MKKTAKIIVITIVVLLIISAGIIWIFFGPDQCGKLSGGSYTVGSFGTSSDSKYDKCEKNPFCKNVLKDYEPTRDTVAIHIYNCVPK